MRVCLGGTFDPFHVGHERLFERAIERAGPAGHVFIGLVSDAFSAGKRRRPVRPYEARRADLVAWLEQAGAGDRVVVNPLEEPFGPSATGDYDVLVVSEETVGTGARINAARATRGLAPLQVEVVPYVLGADLLPISGTRIAAGLIDRDGQRRTPLRVAVGSANPVKVAAVRHAFERFFAGIPVATEAVDAPSGVPEQPFGRETAAGARQRALAALEASTDADYAVGVEAGLMADPFCRGWLDVQHCVVVDPLGWQTHGHGSGFHYPDEVVKEVVQGRTIGAVLAELSGDPDIGRTQGAVGWLTGGRLDRTRLTEQAVEAALVPRVQRALYTHPGPPQPPEERPDPHPRETLS